MATAIICVNNITRVSGVIFPVATHAMIDRGVGDGDVDPPETFWVDDVHQARIA